jgi:hypothetical protein
MKEKINWVKYIMNRLGPTKKKKSLTYSKLGEIKKLSRKYKKRQMNAMLEKMQAAIESNEDTSTYLLVCVHELKQILDTY